MKAGRDTPGGLQTARKPLDAVGVFGVNHGHGTVLPGHRQHIEDLTIVELEVVVGHVDLERRVALRDQLGQLALQHVGRRIAHDQVKGVVHMGLALGSAVVVLHRCAQRLSLVLGRKRDDGGGASAGGRAGTGVEVVRHAHRRRHGLIQVAVGVHAARRHDAATRVDFAHPGGQRRTNLDDTSLVHADVAIKAVTGGRDARVAHHEVEGGRAGHGLVGSSDHLYTLSTSLSTIWCINAFIASVLQASCQVMTGHGPCLYIDKCKAIVVNNVVDTCLLRSPQTPSTAPASQGKQP